MFSFIDILFLLLLFLLLFISIFLFTSDKGKRVSNILIGLFFLVICLNLADSFLLLKRAYFQHPAWALWGSNLLLLCGPFIFFYTQSVVYSDFNLTKRRLLHLFPFLIFFSFSEISYLGAGYGTQIEILNRIIERKLPPAVYIGSFIIYIHFFSYLFGSLRLVKKYELAASNQYSADQKVTLSWLKTTIWFFLALMLVSTINSYLSLQSLIRPYFFVLSITVFLLLLFIIFMLFKALRNPGIFSAWNEKEIEEAIQTPKYISPALDNEKQFILEKLQRHMLSSRPFLEPELTLDELAAQLSVKPKMLSQTINELLNQNFFEFINHYRIEEAKRLLTNPKDKKITVLEVMYEVGFNSKSSFNTIFKKSTGFTPSQYKKTHLQ